MPKAQHMTRKNWFRDGDAVATTSGRIGMARTIGQYHVRVQFGVDGPFNTFHRDSLRLAKATEVDDAGMTGVGGLVVRRND